MGKTGCRDVLDFSKLDAGAVEIEDVAFDLTALLAGTIEIVCDAREDELRVLVRDHSPSIHLEPLPADGFPEGRTEELGVFLIRALMDSVDYTSDPRRGTELVMTKRVNA